MKDYVGIKHIEAEPQKKDGKAGYKVVYDDGYESWSPKETFENAYHTSGEMSFSDALFCLKQGKKVARKYWNRKLQFLFLARRVDFPADIDTKKIPCVESIEMQIEQNTIIYWLAGQNDLLANDWLVVE